jgi:septum site-determining protein MinD
VVYDLINVIQGEANLNQALIKDKHCEKLYILAASQTRDKDALTLEGVHAVMRALEAMGFDYIVCDSPAGIEAGASMAMHFADQAFIATNPDISSVRDAGQMLRKVRETSLGVRAGGEPIKAHLLITRYDLKRVAQVQMLAVEDIQDLLGGIGLLGIVPESDDVLTASNQGTPVIYRSSTEAAMAYRNVVDRFLDISVPLYSVENSRRGSLTRLFGLR